MSYGHFELSPFDVELWTPTMPPLGSKNAINFLHKFVYPLLLLFWISLDICRVNKEPFLYSLRVEEREATSVPNSGTLVIGMHGLRPRAVLLVAVSPLIL